MRLIDADKIDFNEVFKGQSDFARDTRETAQSLIDSQPDMSRWIPVGERLPEEPEPETDPEYLPEYIVMISGAQLPTALSYAGKGKWWHAGDDAYYPIVAWRSMPEPYMPQN